MELTLKEPSELLPKDLIRVETALSRNPIHRISKKGDIEIELREVNDRGEVTFNWGVTYTKKYGQPGPLAYKVDTLIINRRIEESGKPVPKLIKLGSLKEVGDYLSSTGDTNRIKQALHQNASAYITAKIRYKGIGKAEHTREIGGTRYTVLFTGDTLPDGREADAVYIILNDWFRETLNTAQTRPLDYDYLKELSPGAQRLYELLSFQMYGAIESERKRAKLLYSEFCTFAPQTRYFDFKHVKKQMYKLHVPHKKSGYIFQVHFQEVTGSTGETDWEMYYTPGLKAKGEHTAAKRKPRQRRPVQLELPTGTDETRALQTPAAVSPAPASLTEEQGSFLFTLTAKGVTESEARKLVTLRLDACRLKVPALDYLPETQGKTNRGGNVRAFIERDDWQLPPAYLEAKAKAEEAARSQARRDQIAGCPLCDASGFRMVTDGKTTAAKKCSHNAQIEARYPGL
jgi:hypothetical protein